MIKKSFVLTVVLSALCSIGLADDSPKGDGAPRRGKDVGVISSPTTAAVTSPVVATVFEGDAWVFEERLGDAPWKVTFFVPTSKVTSEKMQNTIDRLQCLHEVFAGDKKPLTQVRIERRNIKVELTTDGQDFKKNIKFLDDDGRNQILMPKSTKPPRCITEEENKKIQENLNKKK